MKEFVINDFLTLKLEDGKTNIYVNGKRFDQCMYLMLNIPIDEAYKFGEIDSIDEAADILGWTDEGQEGIDYEIDPETEFWGYCSNLQTWYEHEYDTRLLHSNISFPLLRNLVEVGDPVAKGMYKEEIVKRFESGYPTVVAFIFLAKFLDYLSEEERRDTIEQNLPVILNALEKQSYEAQSDFFERLISFSKETDLLEKNFLLFLDSIEKLTGYEMYYAFSILFDSIKNTKIIEEYRSRIESKILFLLEKVNKLVDYDGERKYNAFSKLIKLGKKMGMMKEHIPLFLKELSNNIDYESYSLYEDLLSTISNRTQQFETVKIILEKTEDPYLKSYVFDYLLTIVEDSEIVKENFEFIMISFEEALDYKIVDYEFSMIYTFIVQFIETLIRVSFLNIEISAKSDDYISDYKFDHSIKGLYTLIEEIKDTEIFEILLPSFLRTFGFYSQMELIDEHYKLFSLFFEIAYKKKLLDKHFIDFVIFFNWNHLGTGNLLENFLKFFSREQIVSFLVPALNNLEWLLEYRHYRRILTFFKKFAKGRNPFLKAFIIDLLKKNSSEINLYLVEQKFLHRLEAQVWKEVLTHLGAKILTNISLYDLENRSYTIAELLTNIKEKAPEILRNVMTDSLKYGSYEFLFSFFKYQMYKMFNEICDNDTLITLLEDSQSSFKGVLIQLLEEDQIRSAVWPDYLKRHAEKYRKRITIKRVEEKRMVITLIFIKMHQDLGAEYINDFFNKLSEIAKIQVIRNTKRLIKYASRPSKDLNRDRLYKIILTKEVKHAARNLLELIDNKAWNKLKYVSVRGEQFYIIHNKLDISRIKLSDISKIKGLQKQAELRKLNLDYNSITKIHGLDTLVNLEVLSLSANHLSKIEGLDTLENLKKLVIYGNNIKEIKGLDNLKNLEYLDLTNNRISEIKGIFHLDKLKTLYLSNNEIKDVNDLDLLTSLETLTLRKNPFNMFSIPLDAELDAELKRNLRFLKKYCQTKRAKGQGRLSLENFFDLMSN